MIRNKCLIGIDNQLHIVIVIMKKTHKNSKLDILLIKGYDFSYFILVVASNYTTFV